jgi:hypothetical protein
MSFAHALPPRSDAFTPELQHAMAAYEAARSRYRAVVRASLDGTVDGASIRAAIEDARAAYAELERCRARGMPVRAEGDRAPSGWPRVRARLASVAGRALRLARRDGGLRVAG